MFSYASFQLVGNLWMFIFIGTLFAKTFVKSALEILESSLSKTGALANIPVTHSRC